MLVLVQIYFVSILLNRYTYQLNFKLQLLAVLVFRDIFHFQDFQRFSRIFIFKKNDFKSNAIFNIYYSKSSGNWKQLNTLIVYNLEFEIAHNL